MTEVEQKLIAMAREPRVEDQAEAAGKYYALTVMLADALEGATGREAARLRDLAYPEYVPESVTDAAFASQADWYTPGVGDGHATVLVPSLIDSIAEAAYRATLAHMKEAPGE